VLDSGDGTATPKLGGTTLGEDSIDGDEGRRRGRPSKSAAVTSACAILRSRRSAALATALAADAGWPYASLVTIACDIDGSPILLLSALSDHTRNLDRDARASLLIENASRRANPQTGPRTTLLGRILADEEPRLRRRFLARHPGALLYAGFGDFRIFRMAVERVHWVGGFGRARWLDAAAILADADAARAIGEAEPTLLEEINRDYAAAIDRSATTLLGRVGSGWRIVAMDTDGCDLARGVASARLPFPRPVRDADDLRATLAGFGDAIGIRRQPS
jgi:putative heme iron utilization protein